MHGSASLPSTCQIWHQSSWSSSRSSRSPNCKMRPKIQMSGYQIWSWSAQDSRISMQTYWTKISSSMYLMACQPNTKFMSVNLKNGLAVWLICYWYRTCRTNWIWNTLDLSTCLWRRLRQTKRSLPLVDTRANAWTAVSLGIKWWNATVKWHHRRKKRAESQRKRKRKKDRAWYEQHSLL